MIDQSGKDVIFSVLLEKTDICMGKRRILSRGRLEGISAVGRVSGDHVVSCCVGKYCKGNDGIQASGRGGIVFLVFV